MQRGKTAGKSAYIKTPAVSLYGMVWWNEGEDYRIGPPPKVHLSVSIPCKKG